jgi:chromosome segregation ATPase
MQDLVRGEAMEDSLEIDWHKFAASLQEDLNEAETRIGDLELDMDEAISYINTLETKLVVSETKLALAEAKVAELKGQLKKCDDAHCGCLGGVAKPLDSFGEPMVQSKG